LREKIFFSAKKIQVCICRANVAAYVNTEKHPQVTAGQVKCSNDKYLISEILGSMQKEKYPLKECYLGWNSRKT